MARIATIGGWNFPIGNQGGIWLLSTSMTRALRPLRVRASNQPANRGRVCPPYWRRIARPAAVGVKWTPVWLDFKDGRVRLVQSPLE